MPLIPDLPQTEIAIVEMTNEYRAGHNLGAVKLNAMLARAARAYGEYLARNDKFAHDADGRQPAERAVNAGYKYCQVAENLALNLDSRGFESRALARKMVDGWINSPGHRKNLLAPSVTEIGVAVVAAPDTAPKFISVQMFGRPQALAYDVEIANTSKVPVTYSIGGEPHQIDSGYSAKHTVCQAGPLVFEKSGSGSAARALTARYEARNGDVYRLKSGKNGTVTIDVTAHRKAK